MARLIDANVLIAFAEFDASIIYPDEHTAKDILLMVETAPTVDAVEVVRCKDCKHRHSSEYCECRPADGYCNDGETGELE